MERGPSQILRYLYLGGRGDARDKATLTRLGVKFILNVTPSRRQVERPTAVLFRNDNAALTRN